MGIKGTAFLGRMGVTVTSTLIAFGIRYSLDPFLEDNAPFLLFYGAIIFSTWYGGWPYGVFCTVVAVFLTIRYFIEPTDHFSLYSRADILSMSLQVATSSLGIFLIEQLRRAQLRA